MRTGEAMTRHFGTVLVALALASSGCAGPEDANQDADTVAAMGDNAASSELAASAGESDAKLPSEFLRSAWRATAADGARFTTLLDPEGRYRDLRNGDPWQAGSWELDGEERLCFLPDGDDGVLRCWQPERMDGRDVMIASNESGRRIRLERADYSPPDEDKDDGGPEDDA